MSEVETHSILGRVIFTNKALSKMRQQGMYRYHVMDALQYGYEVAPLVPSLQ